MVGKGSNSLFNDKGFKGLAVLNRVNHIEFQNDGKIRVGSGFGFARLGGITAKLGLSGLEFAAGIPATVGGAVFMNAGANGQQTADALAKVVFVTQQGDLAFFNKNELAFAYRTSIFQTLKGAIAEVFFALESSDGAMQKQKKLLDYRLKTQPYGEKSAGCAFRNPPTLSAGELIEKCGLKGSRVGGAIVSQLHGNFIVNAGQATAQDVVDLMQLIKERVFKETGILLEEEIRRIPYEF
jgi:UDP-N-acetylmuramate dehydrogenase